MFIVWVRSTVECRLIYFCIERAKVDLIARFDVDRRFLARLANPFFLFPCNSDFIGGFPSFRGLLQKLFN